MLSSLFYLRVDDIISTQSMGLLPNQFLVDMLVPK
jgi:hypothetical protein